LALEPVSLVNNRGRLRWFEHADCKDDGDWIKQCMSMETEGTRRMGQPRKTSWECVKDDMKSSRL